MISEQQVDAAARAMNMDPWGAGTRQVVRAGLEAAIGVDLSFEQKSDINRLFVELYESGMESGKRGQYETMFVAMHQAYRSILGRDTPIHNHSKTP